MIKFNGFTLKYVLSLYCKVFIFNGFILGGWEEEWYPLYLGSNLIFNMYALFEPIVGVDRKVSTISFLVTILRERQFIFQRKKNVKFVFIALYEDMSWTCKFGRSWLMHIYYGSKFTPCFLWKEDLFIKWWSND